MNNAYDVIRCNLSSLSDSIASDPTPLELLDQAYKKILEEKQVRAGNFYL